ncbi:MAG: WhiB-like transcription regulator, partial [uncultured Actinomycetospora sp.]
EQDHGLGARGLPRPRPRTLLPRDVPRSGLGAGRAGQGRVRQLPDPARLPAVGDRHRPGGRRLGRHQRGRPSRDAALLAHRHRRL